MCAQFLNKIVSVCVNCFATSLHYNNNVPVGNIFPCLKSLPFLFGYFCITIIIYVTLYENTQSRAKL